MAGAAKRQAKKRIKKAGKKLGKKVAKKSIGKLVATAIGWKVALAVFLVLCVMFLAFGVGAPASAKAAQASARNKLEISRRQLTSSPFYQKDVPGGLRDEYPKASRCHVDLPWQLIAALGSVETDQAYKFTDLFGPIDPATKVDWATGAMEPPFVGAPMDATGPMEQVPETKFKLYTAENGPGTGEEIYDSMIGPFQLRHSFLDKYGVRSDRMKAGTFNIQNVYDNAYTLAESICAFTTPEERAEGTYNKIELMAGLDAFYNEAHVFSEACTNSPPGYPVYAPCPEAPFPNCIDAFGRVPADAGLPQPTTPGSVVKVKDTDDDDEEHDDEETVDDANGPVVTTTPGATTTTAPATGPGVGVTPASSSIDDYTVTRAAYSASVSAPRAVIPDDYLDPTTTTTTPRIEGDDPDHISPVLPAPTTTTTPGGTPPPATVVIVDPGASATTTTTKPKLPPCPPLITEPTFPRDFEGWATKVIERAVEYGLENPEAFGLVVEQTYSYSCVLPPAFTDPEDPAATTTTTTIAGATTPKTDTESIIQYSMAAIRAIETGGGVQAYLKKGPFSTAGVYDHISRPSPGASGAYQIQDGTWHDWGGTGRAGNATKEVQDQIAHDAIGRLIAQYGSQDWMYIYFLGHMPSKKELTTVPGTENGITSPLIYKEAFHWLYQQISGGTVPIAQCAPGTIPSDPGAPPPGPGGAKGPVVPFEQTAMANGLIRVNKSIVANVEALLNAARAAGLTLAGGGYRSYDQQVATRRANCGTSNYAIYEAPNSYCKPPTAKPGSSMHERGTAIDFTNGSRILNRSDPQYAWLKANAAKYGLYNYPVEPWHWSVNGK